MRKLLAAPVIAFAAIAVSGPPAFAHECVNADKPAGAGAQAVLAFDETTGEDVIVDAKAGLIKRFEKGVIDPDTGEGFHGIIAFDNDGDGVADLSTYIVTPNDELPQNAQLNGSPDHGIVNICTVIPCE